ncbi:endoglucanase 25 isoform X1 [Amborella trichopoda]|uniref:Endoglucanase n=1 Tax=Amborella trichopoda TaxID=13333 RepID=U5DHG6_AMBTC|nr:endoglucanase 25 isoform X1 [Amborella trichopoda]ERN19923.1 hypothetical protein AMTR_s00071p00095020 [Amborella trichopoda]|eukprot:XP_006858456.1 endoglucanase 25 isoform X1 [Amborella trichopoda]
MDSRGPSSPASQDSETVQFVHFVPETGRLLPSASRWNSIDIDFGLGQANSLPFHVIPSLYSKSVSFNLFIADKQTFKRFLYVLVALVILTLSIALVLVFVPHRHSRPSLSPNITLALHQALLFFDAQKSGILPTNNPVKFRGDSGKFDGNFIDISVDLVGGFYDSGNNIKFTFPTAYTVTLLSWSVIEYHKKYEIVDELESVKEVIRWGCDFLLKTIVLPNITNGAGILYSQVGSGPRNNSNGENDLICWQRPEDMDYPRPVSICRNSGVDLSSEIAAALAAASMVFKQDEKYSIQLLENAVKLFNFTKQIKNMETYTADESCGGDARAYYNSTGYLDELVWGGTWLFFATGNTTYLEYVTDNFELAIAEENSRNKGVFYWDNKIVATSMLLTRLRYFNDPGYPSESILQKCESMTKMIMCSYLPELQSFDRTPGGLILLRPDTLGPLQFAATAAFLSKLYKDYLVVQRTSNWACGDDVFPMDVLEDFSLSQVEYILGKNPMKMSYLVGFGDHFPNEVHHRGASIPWDNKHYSCEQGKTWLSSKNPNPNVLDGAMVAGPNKGDEFIDNRASPEYTEPTISSNAGLVAALVALLEPASSKLASDDIGGGIDDRGIFENIHLIPPSNTTLEDP